MPLFEEVLSNMWDPMRYQDVGGGGFNAIRGPRDELPNATQRRMVASAMLAHNAANVRPGPYLTQLSRDQEKLFDAWSRGNKEFSRVGLTPDNPFPDYDLRGLFMAMLQGNPQAVIKNTKEDWSGHPLFPGRYVTPYNTEFGPMSQYWKDRTQPK